MKKIVLIISGIMVFATMAMGCSRENTNIEGKLIDRANILIEEKYEVEIDKDDYIYDLGEVLDANKFVDIQEDKIPKEVFIRATNKEKPISGKVFDYSIKFNTKTDEIIESDCLVY